MNFSMARITNSSYVKPMLWFVTLGVMIQSCLATTWTLKGCRFGEKFTPDRFIHGGNCLSSFREEFFSSCSFRLHYHLDVFLLITLVLIFPICFPCFFCILVSPPSVSCAFCLAILACKFIRDFAASWRSTIVFSRLGATRFATSKSAIFTSIIFVIFRQWKNVMTFCTGLHYDGLRHLLFLYKSLCLEPVGSYLLPIGSHYYTRDIGGRQ